jgi:hypothetical protein
MDETLGYEEHAESDDEREDFAYVHLLHQGSIQEPSDEHQREGNLDQHGAEDSCPFL